MDMNLFIDPILKTKKKNQKMLSTTFESTVCSEHNFIFVLNLPEIRSQQFSFIEFRFNKEMQLV